MPKGRYSDLNRRVTFNELRRRAELEAHQLDLVGKTIKMLELEFRFNADIKDLIAPDGVSTDVETSERLGINTWTLCRWRKRFGLSPRKQYKKHGDTTVDLEDSW